MRYKVWIEIEGVPGEGDDPDGYVVGGDLGVLPDPLGSFDTLDEARSLVVAVLTEFNPSELDNSDAVDHNAPCISCGRKDLPLFTDYRCPSCVADHNDTPKLGERCGEFDVVATADPDHLNPAKGGNRATDDYW